MGSTGVVSIWLCIAVGALACGHGAGSAPARTGTTTAEPTGEFEKPASDGLSPPAAGTSWDVLGGLLHPGEHVQSIEDVTGDRVAVHVHDGKHGRTVWLHKYPDGSLGLE